MQGKTIVLGVTGGIAAYKACEIASRLTQSGARVHVVMTSSAQRFVAPLTFQALTHQPVHVSLWPQNSEGESGVFAAMAHIALADEADAVLVAPASANTLAKLAHGFSDDLLSTLILATRAPVLLCPAMNPQMWNHAATQKNARVLADELGYFLLSPESGRMACEHVGAGRLPPTETILAELQRVLDARVLAAQNAAARAENASVSAAYSAKSATEMYAENGAIFQTQSATRVLAANAQTSPTAEARDDATFNNAAAPRVRARDLQGVSILVTAGPTREMLDPVRFLTNRSSGKMGYAIAENAAARGARVTLISGPTQIAPPPNVETMLVESTQQMFEAATRAAKNCDIIIAAAAPADFRAKEIAPQKIKRASTRANAECKSAERDSSESATLNLQLEATPDIVATIGAAKNAHQIVIGFAAETGSDLAEARRKLNRKNCDAIVFNDVTQVGAGFDVDTNRVTWLDARGETAWPLLHKSEVAARILDEAKKMRAAKS